MGTGLNIGKLCPRRLTFHKAKDGWKSKDTYPMGEQRTEEAEGARRILAEAETGMLGTLDPAGHPFVTLVAVAPGPDGAPVMLLSGLAAHTRHLARDPRASLLLLSREVRADPLAGARLTLVGTVREDAGPAAREAFLARHPEAAGYAGFADFGFRRFEPSGGHLVAGFGKIVTLGAADLL